MNKKLGWVIFLTTLLLGVWLYQSKPQSILSETSPPELLPAKTPTSPSTHTPDTKPVDSSHAQLEKGFEEVKNSLPTFGHAKEWSSEEIHHAPKKVLDGGKEIGRLLELADKESTRREPTLKFLVICAEDADLLPAIRAVCWRGTTDHIVKWKVFIPVSDADVPNEIKILAAQL